MERKLRGWESSTSRSLERARAQTPADKQRVAIQLVIDRYLQSVPISPGDNNREVGVLTDLVTVAAASDPEYTRPHALPLLPQALDEGEQNLYLKGATAKHALDAVEAYRARQVQEGLPEIDADELTTFLTRQRELSKEDMRSMLEEGEYFSKAHDPEELAASTERTKAELERLGYTPLKPFHTDKGEFGTVRCYSVSGSRHFGPGSRAKNVSEHIMIDQSNDENPVLVYGLQRKADTNYVVFGGGTLEQLLGTGNARLVVRDTDVFSYDTTEEKGFKSLRIENGHVGRLFANTGEITVRDGIIFEALLRGKGTSLDAQTTDVVKARMTEGATLTMDESNAGKITTDGRGAYRTRGTVLEAHNNDLGSRMLIDGDIEAYFGERVSWGIVTGACASRRLSSDAVLSSVDLANKRSVVHTEIGSYSDRISQEQKYKRNPEYLRLVLAIRMLTPAMWKLDVSEARRIVGSDFKYIDEVAKRSDEVNPLQDTDLLEVDKSSMEDGSLHEQLERRVARFRVPRKNGK